MNTLSQNLRSSFYQFILPHPLVWYRATLNAKAWRSDVGRSSVSVFRELTYFEHFFFALTSMRSQVSNSTSAEFEQRVCAQWSNNFLVQKRVMTESGGIMRKGTTDNRLHLVLPVKYLENVCRIILFDHTGCIFFLQWWWEQSWNQRVQ